MRWKCLKTKTKDQSEVMTLSRGNSPYRKRMWNNIVHSELRRMLCKCRERVMKHLEANDSESTRVIDHRDRENRWLEKHVEMADLTCQKTNHVDEKDGVEKTEIDEPNNAEDAVSNEVCRYAKPDSTEDLYMEVNEQCHEELTHEFNDETNDEWTMTCTIH